MCDTDCDNHYFRLEQLRSTLVDKNSLEIFSNHVFSRREKKSLKMLSFLSVVCRQAHYVCTRYLPSTYYVSVDFSTLGTVAPKKLWNFIAHEAHAKPKFELRAKKWSTNWEKGS